jgi:3-hydroxyanthranilate 3,4-dioxygenase
LECGCRAIAKTGVHDVNTLPVLKLFEIAQELAESGRRVKVLWQEEGSLAFVARGREYRSEFHVNGSAEVTYMIKGTMNLHYRTPEGREEIAVLPEGSTNYMPPNTPHSPRFPPDAFALIMERQRHPGEIDRFHWFCQKCGAFLHEETFVVEDYRADPVSLAYKHFFDSEEARTCKACGTVMPAPQSA